MEQTAVLDAKPFVDKLAAGLNVDSILLLLACGCLAWVIKVLWQRLTVVMDSHQKIASDNVLAMNALSVAMDRLREKLDK